MNRSDSKSPPRVQSDTNLNFIMRHIDNEPDLSFCRFIEEVKEMVADTAIAFTLVGEIDGATRLLELLKSHGIDPFFINHGSWPFLKPCMYFAWEATRSWPDWIPSEERTEENLQELERKGRSLWEETIDDKWEISEQMAKNGLGLAYPGIILHLPNGTPGQRMMLAIKKWNDGMMPHAASIDAPRSAYYSLFFLWWRQGCYPYGWAQAHRTIGLTIAFDIYCRLDQMNDADEVLERMCERFQCEDQARMMGCSRDGWNKVFSMPDSPMLERLDIHPAKMRAAVRRATQMLERRLNNGPKRPFRDKSMEELIQIISANTHHNFAYERLEAIGPPRNRASDERSQIMAPATEEQIVEMEKRLDVELPQDYKDFLSISNGMGELWTGAHALRVLGGIECTKVESEDYMCIAINLVNERSLPPSRGNGIDWLEFEAEDWAVNIGGDAGHDGEVWLFGPDFTRRQKQIFFKAYNERTETQREELRQAVCEVYGSMEAFEKLEWSYVRWMSWNFEVFPFNGVRDILERLAEDSLRKAKAWDRIFEPGNRRVVDMTDSDEEFIHGKDGTENNYEDTMVTLMVNGESVASYNGKKVIHNKRKDGSDDEEMT